MSVQDSKDRRMEIQKRTFTKWINVYLSRHESPAEVCSLFQDLHDGKILMMLLEEMTGCKLLYRYRSSSHRIFRLNNISKALAFLDDRHVKLLGIEASAVADGVPSVVLNLIWNIILHFQVKEMTGGLHRRLSSSLSSLSIDSESTEESAPNPVRNTVKSPKYSGKTIKSLLHWVQRCTVKFGVEVRDFGRSWRNGLAFLALIKSINPELVDLRQSLTKDPEENLEQAFRTAHQHLDIPPLLEPQDVACSCPDEKSVITYVSMFLRHCPDLVEDLSSAVSSPHISKFRSLETLADREEAPPEFSRLETSHELLLWKRWARRSSSGSAPRNKRRSPSSLQPPSPLDANVSNQEIRSWLDGSLDHGYSKMKNNEIHFSLSSEEGVYSVTPLDSDEEDAYSYIMDLNEDVAQSQAKRQIPRVEEETEELSLICDKEQVESVHLNGDCKGKSANIEQKGAIVIQNSEVGKAESLTIMGESLKSTKNITKLESNTKEMPEKEERNAQAEAGYLKNPIDNLQFKVKNLLQAANEGKKLKHIEKIPTSRDSFIENRTEDINKAKDITEFNTLRVRKKVEGEAKLKVGSEGGSGNVSVSRNQNISIDQPLNLNKKHCEVSEAKCKHGPSSVSERRVLLQSVAPSCGLNTTELQMMLLLWMLLYCYFIGQQIIAY